MRIGVDATSWVNRRGYGRFVRNALSHLVALDPSTRYVFYIDAASAPRARLPDGAEEHRVALRSSSGTATADSNRSPYDLFRLMRATRGESLDAFLFPSIYTYFPVFAVPTVVGIHDVTVSDFPRLTMPSRRALLFWRLKESFATRHATALFTVSEASRSAVALRFGVPPERIAVVPEAPDAAFRPRLEAEVARVLQRYRLERGDFLVYAAGVSPHKNLGVLLDALGTLRGDPRAPRLVLAGDLEDKTFLSAAHDVRKRIAHLGLEHQVVLPGFVSDDDLACLYTACAAAVVTSLSEGFGLPAVEAAACGAPTVLSDLPAHRETLGDAALFFRPNDVQALAQHLEQVQDEALRRRMGEAGRRSVAPLSWDTAAERLRAILAEVALGAGG